MESQLGGIEVASVDGFDVAMSLRSIIRVPVVWVARATARLAVALHPLLELRSNSPSYRFIEDGLATCQNSDFTNDPRFKRAYELGKQTGSWHDHDLRWRIHVLLWCASWAAQLRGSFVECGVFRGGFARAIIDYTNYEALGKEYYLFDTFGGFDTNQLSDNEVRSVIGNYNYGECYEFTLAQFSSMPFVHLVRGSVPQSLVDVGPVGFLSIDMNCAAPEIAAAKFYWPHLVPGGVIVLDDYGFELHHEQKTAFDALAKLWKVEILSLPTGQGLIFKPVDLNH